MRIDNNDKVYVFDPMSDLHLRKGEVLDIVDDTALVMFMSKYPIGGCIADYININKVRRNFYSSRRNCYR